MSHALAIQTMPPIPERSGTTAPNKGGGATPEPPAKPAQTYTNPGLRLDPALGLVVIEFHDASGKLTSSIPSQRQIDAYRMHETTPPGRGNPEPANAKTPPG